MKTKNLIDIATGTSIIAKSREETVATACDLAFARMSNGENLGATVDVMKGRLVQDVDAWAVSCASLGEIHDRLTFDILYTYVHMHWDFFAAHSDAYLGLWRSEEQVFLDVTFLIKKNGRRD